MLLLVIASCANTPGISAVRSSSYFATHARCDDGGNDGVQMWRCQSDRKRLDMDWMAIYWESWQHPPKLLILRKSGYEPTLVLDVSSDQRCTPNFPKTYLVSRDGWNGEMHIPVECRGYGGEFVWREDGEFTRYLGLRFTDERLPKFFWTHTKCLGAGNDGVRMWRCLSPMERMQSHAWGIVTFYSTPQPGEEALPPLRILRYRGDEPLVVLDKHTQMICVPNYPRAYVLSRDNDNGEMHIPAYCEGKAFELVWHMEGEFDRYMGLRAVKRS